MNYFEFYDMPVSFFPDQAELKRRFFEKSKRSHPDFFTRASEDEQAAVLNEASYNNEAYRTLKDDDKRLHYILTLTKALNEENKNQIPQAFLMEMMDLNEKVMELQFDYDQQKADSILTELRSIQDELMSEVRPIMKAYSSEQDLSTLTPVKDYYLKSKYLHRLHTNISQIPK